MIELTHDLLLKLCQKSSYMIEHDPIVFFGVRGMLPIDVAGTGFAASQKLQSAPIDHRFMRCTLGQWLPAKAELAVVPGSTVPHIRNIEKWLGRGGTKTNMLMLGKYLYAKGRHKNGKTGQHRAFRQATFFPVWRTSDDLDYQLDDILDNDGGMVWDNLHCAANNNLDIANFGSAGCQVVAGVAGKPDSDELGPWKVFIDHAYSGPGKDQQKFDYVLISGFELARLAEMPDGKQIRTCRFGSVGLYVQRLQQGLASKGYPGFDAPDASDGIFGRNTLEALVAFQRNTFGQADGVAGPQTASALGIEWDEIEFPTRSPTRATSATPAAATPSLDGIPPDWIEDAIKVTCRFENDGDPYLGVSGNFDGQGVSCGALQWNLGQSSLQPLVKAVGEPLVKAKMPNFGADLWLACQGSGAAAVKIAAGWHSRNKLKPKFRDELVSLLDTAEMRAEQNKAMAVNATKAILLAASFAAARSEASPSKRAYMWFFDIVCQNGSMKGIGYDDVKNFVGGSTPKQAVGVVCDTLKAVPGSTGHAADAHKNAKLWKSLTDPEAVDLLVLSHLRAAKSMPEWRHIVLNRKGTVAAGKGHVNSSLFDLQWAGL